MLINLKDRLDNSVTNIPELWRGSAHESWFLNNNAAKGSHGTYCYKVYLQNLGYEVEVISDQGDLRYRKTPSDSWIKVEVKASKANVSYTKSGSLKMQLWFNQLRPNQKGWHEVALVGVFPNHVRIWRKTREDWDKECNTLDSTTRVLEHIGTNELRGVQLVKNTKKNNFDEWECIHNDQQGDLL